MSLLQQHLRWHVVTAMGVTVLKAYPAAYHYTDVIAPTSGQLGIDLLGKGVLFFIWKGSGKFSIPIYSRRIPSLTAGVDRRTLVPGEYSKGHSELSGISMEGRRFCGSHGESLAEEGPIDPRVLAIFSEFDGKSGTTYHRRTSISKDGSTGLMTVECSESSWIAVEGKECICVITRDTAEVKSEKPPDLCQILSDWDTLPKAKVSRILGTNELRVGNGIADSFAEYYEIVAINYLKQKLIKEPDLTYEETLQTAISAYRLLLPGSINANEIKICVGRMPERNNELRRKPSSISILGISEVAALLNANRMADEPS